MKSRQVLLHNAENAFFTRKIDLKVRLKSAPYKNNIFTSFTIFQAQNSWFISPEVKRQLVVWFIISYDVTHACAVLTQNSCQKITRVQCYPKNVKKKLSSLVSIFLIFTVFTRRYQLARWRSYPKNRSEKLTCIKYGLKHGNYAKII